MVTDPRAAKRSWSGTDPLRSAAAENGLVRFFLTQRLQKDEALPGQFHRELLKWVGCFESG